MDHILFVYSSISGHLDCFHLLATMNNATMHMDIPIKPLLSNLLDVDAEVELLVSLCLIFLKNQNTNYFKTWWRLSF